MLNKQAVRACTILGAKLSEYEYEFQLMHEELYHNREFYRSDQLGTDADSNRLRNVIMDSLIDVHEALGDITSNVRKLEHMCEINI